VTEPLTIDAKVFYGMQLGNVKLTVPAGSKSLYELADVWKDFGNITESSTGIALTGADECKASDEMFDLSGAAIETRPENGIFIQGRKKMMITK
ncbi:MAG: hypothetical protein KBT20_10740, partial [Bacteroidales bacterium]|nr:hypothetical protein [Candidatus Liminaster caballi]